MAADTFLTTGPRLRPRLKFVWGSSKVINARWRLGLFGFYERVHGFPRSGFVVSIRGAVRWLLALGLVGYLGAALLLSRWLARVPHNQIGFVDLLTWPVRRGHVAELRGRAWLAQGKDALAAKRWGEGVFLLRKGLETCPNDFDARRALAQIYLLSGERSRAVALLADGPRYGLPTPAWIEEVLVITEAGEDWQTMLRICDRCLEQLSASQRSERQRLLARKMVALIALNRAGEALALAEAEGAAAAPPVKTQRARALLALGRAEAAAAFLAQWQSASRPEVLAPIIQLRVRALREAGRSAEMDRVLGELRARYAAAPEALAFAVEQRALARRGAGAALDDYLFRFGAKSADLLLVAEPLAAIPDAALVQRVVTAAGERGFALRPFRVHLAQAYLREGNWGELARLVARLEPMFARAEATPRIWFEWIRALSDVLASPTSGAQERLTSFMHQRPLGLEAHRLTVTALRRAGQLEAAQAVLVVARKYYPESPWLHAQQVEVERDVAALAPPKVAESLPDAPVNWDEFSRELDATIAARKWNEAQRLLFGVRHARRPPEWIDAHDSDLRRRELRVTQGLGDAPALRLGLRLYLNGTPERAAEVVAFAQELHAAGAKTDAVMMVKAVLEKTPDYLAAQALLAEWQPPKKK